MLPLIMPALLNICLLSLFIDATSMSVTLFLMHIVNLTTTTMSSSTIINQIPLLLIIVSSGSIVFSLRSIAFKSLEIYIDRFFSKSIYDIIHKKARNSGIRSGFSLLNNYEFVKKTFVGSRVIPALNFPWAILYLCFAFYIHYIVGLLLIAGMGGIPILTIIHRYYDRKVTTSTSEIQEKKNLSTLELMHFYEVSLPPETKPYVIRRWIENTSAARDFDRKISSSYSAFDETLKFYKQSVSYGLLVVYTIISIGDRSSLGSIMGVIIISNISLSIIQAFIDQIPFYVTALKIHDRLELDAYFFDQKPHSFDLPRFSGSVSVRKLAIVSDVTNECLIENLSLDLAPGQALSLFGSDSHTKEQILAAMVGLTLPASGEVRFDGASLSQISSPIFGANVGFFPTEIGFVHGTVAENISRFRFAESHSIKLAAKIANADEVILSLPQGYDTLIGSGGHNLKQREKLLIGLTRAVFGEPRVVVLNHQQAFEDDFFTEKLISIIKNLKSRNVTVIYSTTLEEVNELADISIMITPEKAVNSFNDSRIYQKPAVVFNKNAS